MLGGIISSNFYLDRGMSRSKWKQISHSLPAGVNLLAVSKGHSVDSIKGLVSCGQLHFGESRVQEAMPKLEALNYDQSLRWHFIGHLQSNKVRTIVRSFDFIHSIHSLSLAERIARISGEERKRPKVMLQVKFRDDPNKSGFHPDQLLESWNTLSSFENYEIVGLMTIAPLRISPTERRELFKDCRFLANRLKLLHCSMGMSSDWEDAVKAGSTWVRIGSEIFGERAKAGT